MTGLGFYYHVVLISSLLIFVEGIVLLRRYIPREPLLKMFRLSCRVMAMMYFVLALPGLIEFFSRGTVSHFPVRQVISLSAVSFQAYLFTFVLLAIVQPKVVSKRLVSKHAMIPIGITVFLVVIFFSGWILAMHYALLAAFLVYTGQIGYYIVLFRDKYSHCLRGFDDYYAGEEGACLRWMPDVFYISMALGVVTLFARYFPPVVFVLFVAAYTFFYIFFARKYMNYMSLSSIVAPVVYLKEGPRTLHDLAGQEAVKTIELALFDDDNKLLIKALKRWERKKEFCERGICLDVVAFSLGTSRERLCSFVQQKKNMDFCTWRRKLRVEYAQELMLRYPEYPLKDISLVAGFMDQVNFTRRFKEITGLTPDEWRCREIGL